MRHTLINKVKDIQVLSLVMTSTTAWVVVLLFMTQILHFNRLISDVAGYWRQSQHLNEFDIFHVPAYAFSIYLLRLIAPNASALLIMSILNFLAWLISVVMVFSIFRAWKLEWAWLGSLVYAFYPLVGITYSVYPLAESLAALCVTTAIFLYIKNHKWSLVAVLAFSLLVQKSLWPFVLGIALVAIYQRKLNWFQVFLIGVPLTLYCLLGSFYYGNPFWLVMPSATAARARGRLPIFDAIFGGLLTGSPNDIVQSIIVIAICIIAMYLLITASWKQEPILLPLILVPLFFGIATGEVAAMVIIRYSKFLVLPLWFHLFPENREIKLRLLKPLLIVFILLELLSQFAFAYYIPLFFSTK